MTTTTVRSSFESQVTLFSRSRGHAEHQRSTSATNQQLPGSIFCGSVIYRVKDGPPQRKAAVMATTTTTTEMPAMRERVAAAEIEMPYLEDEKGASGWSAVEVRSRKNLPGNKREYCLREHTKQFQRFEPFLSFVLAYPRFHVSNENSFTWKC